MLREDGFLKKIISVFLFFPPFFCSAFFLEGGLRFGLELVIVSRESGQEPATVDKTLGLLDFDAWNTDRHWPGTLLLLPCACSVGF